MNIVLLIVDSLRKQSIPTPGSATPSFFSTFAGESVSFERAYATECWTLPTHLSMFTGLMPSEHGAHFQTMAYEGKAPTIAELLAERGYATELATRNPVLDGTIPGVARGFSRIELILADYGRGLNPLSMGLALSKPRFRRQIKASGFFTPEQRASREFLAHFARATLPADDQVLAYAIKRLDRARRSREKLFLVCNLYDVHAPYPPSSRSIFRSWRSSTNWLENARMPFVLPHLGGHAYLREGFHLSDANRKALLGRYESAIALMGERLERFVSDAAAEGLLDDTLLIVTSDHGEAFGEHGLYLHDASVFQTHLHVPLYVRNPSLQPARVDDVVSMRHLFGLMLSAGSGDRLDDTLVGAEFRGRNPVARAEHFYYPHSPHMAKRFRVNQSAVIVEDRKYIRRGDTVMAYDLTADPLESSPREARSDCVIRTISDSDSGRCRTAIPEHVGQ